MSALIESFKREHSEIIDKLKECREYGIFTKKGQAKLKSVKISLLEHLKEEDEKFYPVLWKEAEENKQLKEELEVFAKDWGNVSCVAFDIFDRYDNETIIDERLLDFGELFSVLQHRMSNEENFLYGEYEKLNKI